MSRADCYKPENETSERARRELLEAARAVRAKFKDRAALPLIVALEQNEPASVIFMELKRVYNFYGAPGDYGYGAEGSKGRLLQWLYDAGSLLSKAEKKDALRKAQA